MAKKKESQENVRCINCEKAALLQWDNNPVVAHCRHCSYPNVANTPRICPEFKKNPKTPEIRKLTHFT
jgi:hypothetical protein